MAVGQRQLLCCDDDDDDYDGRLFASSLSLSLSLSLAYMRSFLEIGLLVLLTSERREFVASPASRL